MAIKKREQIDYMITFKVVYGNAHKSEEVTVFYENDEFLGKEALMEDIKKRCTAFSKAWISLKDQIHRISISFMYPLLLVLCCFAGSANAQTFQSIQSLTLEDEVTCNKYTVSYIGNCLTIAPSRCLSNIFLDISSKKVHTIRSPLGQCLTFQSKGYTVVIQHNTKIEKVCITSDKLNLVLI